MDTNNEQQQPVGTQLITLDPEQYVAQVFAPFRDRLEAAKTAAAAVTTMDVTTSAGMKAAIAYRATFRELRVEAEKARQIRKKPILEIGRLLDSRAKELEAEITPFEDRFDSAIKAEETRKEAEKAAAAAHERQRIERIQLAIRDIRGSLIDVAGRSSDAIKEKLQVLVALEIGPATFNEFALEADAARTDVLAKLREMHDTVQAQEAETRRLADERAEFERLRIEQAAELKRREDDAARVSGIRAEIESIAALPVRLIGRGSAVIEPYLDDLKERGIHEDEFGEFVSEAAGARATAVEQIESMLNDARAREQVQADQARVDAERKRLADEEEERQRAARREQEERERQERLALEARERDERLAREHAEREERELVEAAQRRRDDDERAERLVMEERAACERAALREIEDADEMLRAFRSRFGANKRYASVVKAIDNYFKPKQPRARQKQPAAASAP